MTRRTKHHLRAPAAATSVTSQHAAHYGLFCVAVITSRLRYHNDDMCIEINCRGVANMQLAGFQIATREAG